MAAAQSFAMGGAAFGPVGIAVGAGIGTGVGVTAYLLSKEDKADDE